MPVAVGDEKKTNKNYQLSLSISSKHTDGRDECGLKCVIGEAKQNARLAHTRITNQEQFE